MPRTCERRNTTSAREAGNAANAPYSSQERFKGPSSDRTSANGNVEVKTREFNELDLEKHKGYRDSISSPQTELIFFSADRPDLDLRGFRFLSWADVCVTLRAIAPRLLGPERILGTAMILASGP